MRVLITGGSGFIGAHVAAALLSRGHEVHVTHRAGSDLRRLHALAPAATRHIMDFSTHDSCARALDTMSAVAPARVLHLAWCVAPGRYLTDPSNVTHLEAAVRVVERATQLRCRRILTAGTCLEYDLTAEQPLRETSAVAPRSLYAACKLALGNIAHEITKNTDTSHTHLRFFNLYGPWEQEGRLVSDVARALTARLPETVRVTSGEQVRDYLHVHDAASAVATILTSGEGPVQPVIHVASGRPIAVRDLIRILATRCGRGALERIQFGALSRALDDPFLVVSAQGLAENRHFSEKFASIEEGLEDTLRYWRERT